jgi:hypothetical protein
MTDWPWPADTPLDRARRVATAAHAALQDADPAAAARLAAWAVEHGQGWLVPTPWPYDDDELITCEQVADACHIEVRTVYRWHQRGLPYVDTPDGIRVRAGDVPAFEKARRQARLKSV